MGTARERYTEKLNGEAIKLIDEISAKKPLQKPQHKNYSPYILFIAFSLNALANPSQEEANSIEPTQPTSFVEENLMEMMQSESYSTQYCIGNNVNFTMSEAEEFLEGLRQILPTSPRELEKMRYEQYLHYLFGYNREKFAKTTHEDKKELTHKILQYLHDQRQVIFWEGGNTDLLFSVIVASLRYSGESYATTTAKVGAHTTVHGLVESSTKLGKFATLLKTDSRTRTSINAYYNGGWNYNGVLH